MAGVVREEENEEGGLTGRTRFHSGGIGWRICPRGRLQQSQECWSFLLQNSHRGLLNPRRKAAFPSKTERERERKREEKKESGRRRRDGRMKIPHTHKKKRQMECKGVPMASRSIGKCRTGRSKEIEVTERKRDLR